MTVDQFSGNPLPVQTFLLFMLPIIIGIGIVVAIVVLRHTGLPNRKTASSWLKKGHGLPIVGLILAISLVFTWSLIVPLLTIEKEIIVEKPTIVEKVIIVQGDPKLCYSYNYKPPPASAFRYDPSERTATTCFPTCPPDGTILASLEWSRSNEIHSYEAIIIDCELKESGGVLVWEPGPERP